MCRHRPRRCDVHPRYYFNSLWNVFDGMDASNAQRIDLEEFEVGMHSIGIELTHDEASGC